MIIARTLPSGICLVMEKVKDAQSACIGVWTGAGSCCETPDIAGISHFIEHMFFKGTKKRTAKEIAQATDNIGAGINAFTSKEATCYHIKALTDVFPQAVDILLDMLKNSLFDPEEMNKERGVILEEMRMVEDTPDDYIFDILTEKVMAGTDVEGQIIGTRKSLKAIDRKAIKAYIKKHYTRDNIVVSVVGNFDENALIEQLESFVSGFGDKSPERGENHPQTRRRFANRVKDINQSHLALGMPTISMADEDYFAQVIVNDVLGGSMSSRLFQNIREEKGLAYSVFSTSQSFTDCGMFAIYAGVTLGKEAEAIDAIAHELATLGRDGLTSEELKIVKQRRKSYIIFGLESMKSRMMQLGRNRLLLGRDYTPEETMAEIDGITLEQVNDFCKRISDIGTYSGVTISKDKLDIKSMIGK